MQINRYKSYEHMSQAVANLVVQQVQRKPDSLICFPSGESPTAMLRILVKLAEDGKVDFNHAHFVALDEWVGLDKNNAGSCSYYLNEHFFSQVDLSPTQIRFFDATAPDLDRECQKMNDYISRLGGLDIMIVGIGMNGHIGLNEPGAIFKAYANHSALDPVTVDVAQKYFKQQPHLSKGITLGLGHLAEAKTPVLMASGEKKADIIARALNGPVSSSVPASIFQTLPNAQVFLDEDAAAKLFSDQEC